MNRLTNIINNNKFEKDKLYLLQNYNEMFGFFYYNGEVIFGKKSDPTSIGSSISTDYLDMELNVHIESLSVENTYSSGQYDLLIFKGLSDEVKMDIFYNICSSYADDQTGITFSDFFNALVDIFREHNDMDYINSVGLLGEMWLIKEVYEKCNINISTYWHRIGINSKFDFSFPNLNIEVKTTCKSEQEFNIKHSQIFNNQNNYVAIINVFETGEGESIASLCDYFQKESPFCNDVRLQICISKELTRVRKPNKNKFSLESIYLVDVNDMDKLNDVPQSISNITYDYDFSGTKKNEIDLLKKLLI